MDKEIISNDYVGCIYEIFYKKDPRYKYIGCTRVSLEERFKQHIRSCDNNKTNKFYKKVKELGGFTEFEIKIIKKCKTLDDLYNGENYFIIENFNNSEIICLNTKLRNRDFKDINNNDDNIIINYDEDGDVIMIDVF